MFAEAEVADLIEFAGELMADGRYTLSVPEFKFRLAQCIIEARRLRKETDNG